MSSVELKDEISIGKGTRGAIVDCLRSARIDIEITPIAECSGTCEQICRKIAISVYNRATAKRHTLEIGIQVHVGYIYELARMG